MAELIVGVDLGGTETKIGVVDKSGRILSKRVMPTEIAQGRIAVVNRIGDCINQLLASSQFKLSEVIGTGVGSPGSINRQTGTVLFSPNLPDWSGFALASELEKTTGIETFIENDANSFVLGEWAFGAFKGSEHMIGLTLGTGVGGGVITHGFLLTGNNGYAGELGHMIIQPDGPLCGCGSHGCLEALASATAVVRLAQEYSKRFPDSLMYTQAGLTAKTVFDCARKGDRAANIILERVTDALALATGNFVHIFNPEHVIIGGGLSRAGDILIEGVREKLPRYVMPSFSGTFRVDLSELVEDAGIIGAASIVFYRLS